MHMPLMSIIIKNSITTIIIIIIIIITIRFILWRLLDWFAK